MFFYGDNIKADLSLKSIHISGSIINNFAYLTETQEYVNNENLNKEIIYVFPLNFNSTITNFEVSINKKKLLKGVILEKKKAIKNYNKAINEGNSALLLNRLSDDTYKINLGQILYRDKVKIRISYIYEITNNISNNLSFHIPTIFGIKYNSSNNFYNEDELKLIDETNITRTNTNRKLSIDLNFFFDYNISKISSPSHNICTDFIDNYKNKVNIKFKENYIPDRDIIINFEFENKFNSSLKYYTNDKNETFVYINYPLDPEKLNIDIKNNNNENNKKSNEYIFLIDTSGSMSGIKLNKAKEILIMLLKNLKENDLVNVIFFNSNFGVFNQNSVQLNKTNLQKLFLFIIELKANGGTEILEPLKYAFDHSKEDANIIILTDFEIGYISSLIETIRRYLNNKKILNIGIDTCFNLSTFEKIQKFTGIIYFYIHPIENLSYNKISDILSLLNFPMIKNLKLKIYNNNNENKNKIEFLNNFSSENLSINFPFKTIFKINGSLPEKIILSGEICKKKFSIEINSSNYIKENEILEKLWAKSKIDKLEEYLSNNSLINERKKFIKKEIINLSMNYNVLSKFTTFFIEYKRNKKGDGFPITTKIASDIPYKWDFSSLKIYDGLNYINNSFSKCSLFSLYDFDLQKKYINFKFLNKSKNFSLPIIKKINILYKILKKMNKNNCENNIKTENLIKNIVKNLRNIKSTFSLSEEYGKIIETDFCKKIKYIYKKIDNYFPDLKETKILKKFIKLLIKNIVFFRKFNYQGESNFSNIIEFDSFI